MTLRYYRLLEGNIIHSLPHSVTSVVEAAKQERFKAAIAEQDWGEIDSIELLSRLMTTAPKGFNQPTTYTLFPDAVVALLLPLLPNLETFSVGASQLKYVGEVIERAKNGAFGSISISNVELLPDDSIGSDGAWADYDFALFKLFADLPRLRSINGKGIGGEFIEDGGTYHNIPSNASDVREIHLRQCELSGGCLSKIIAFSTGLEAFTYRYGGRAGQGGGTSMLLSPEVAKALTPHRLTLKSLDLDFDNQSWDTLEEEMLQWESQLSEELDQESSTEGGEEEDEPVTVILESAESDLDDGAKKLKKEMGNNPYFPHLTHLRIGLRVVSKLMELSGKKSLAEWLPSSLEELEFVDYQPHDTTDIINQVKDVVERWETLLPALKVLKGIEEYIKSGMELEDEEDYVPSDNSADDDSPAEDDSGAEDSEDDN